MADEDADHFSLRWNNFHSNLTSGFHLLLQSEDLVDVTLAAGGQFVQAHKIVLSVCSPYFKQLFKVNPCKHPIVILKDVSYNELVSILQFMYKGEVNVRQEELSAFLKTAETLQIKGLTGDESSLDDQTHEELRTKTPPPPPVERAVERTFKRHLAHQKPHVHLSPPPMSRPSTTKRLRIDKKQTSSATVPVLSPCKDNAINFVEMHKPKSEPVDYDSDIDELERHRTEAVVQLLEGETSLSLHEDTDSHQSHYDSPLRQVDSSQSHLDIRQSLGISNPSLTDTGLSVLNNTQGIAGNSQMQDVLQDGSQAALWHSLAAISDFNCPHCPRIFSTSSNLRIHIRDIHSGEGRTTCHECGKQLKNPSCLRMHVYRKHTSRNLIQQPLDALEKATISFK